jgi:hypothetical protein
MHLSGLAHAAASYRGLVLIAFQNPAEFLWASPAGAAVVRCRFCSLLPRHASGSGGLTLLIELFLERR